MKTREHRNLNIYEPINSLFKTYKFTFSDADDSRNSTVHSIF